MCESFLRLCIICVTIFVNADDRKREEDEEEAEGEGKAIKEERGGAGIERTKSLQVSQSFKRKKASRCSKQECISRAKEMLLYPDGCYSSRDRIFSQLILNED